MSKKPVRMMNKEELIAHYQELSRQYGILIRSAGRTGVISFIPRQQEQLAEAGAYLLCKFGVTLDQLTAMRREQQEGQQIG